MSTSESDLGTAHSGFSREVIWAMWQSIEPRIQALAYRSGLAAADCEMAATRVMFVVFGELEIGRCHNPLALGICQLRHELGGIRKCTISPRPAIPLSEVAELSPYHAPRPECATLREWLGEHWSTLEQRLSDAESRALRKSLGSSTQREIVSRLGGSARGYRTLIDRAVAKIRLAVTLKLVPPPPPLQSRREALASSQRATNRDTRRSGDHPCDH
jgi:hypothetical protein